MLARSGLGPLTAEGTQKVRLRSGAADGVELNTDETRPSTKGLDFTAEPADQYVDGDDAYMYYNNSAKLVVLFLVQLSRVRRAFRKVSSCLVAGSNFVTSAEEILKRNKTRGALASFDCDQV